VLHIRLLAALHCTALFCAVDCILLPCAAARVCNLLLLMTSSTTALARVCVLLACGADGGWEVAEAAIAYGGVAALTIMAPQVGLPKLPCSCLHASTSCLLQQLAPAPHGVNLNALAPRHVFSPWRRLRRCWLGGQLTAQPWRLASRLCSRMCKSVPTRQVGCPPACLPAGLLACLPCLAITWRPRVLEPALCPCPVLRSACVLIQRQPPAACMSKPCVQIMLIYTPLYCPSPCCCTAGGMVEFRRSLAASFLFKGLLFVAQQLEAEVPAYQSPFPENYRSGGGRAVDFPAAGTEQ
jgi:hypothetical protein